MLRDIALIVFVTCTTISGQLLLKRGVTEIGMRDPAPSGLDWLLATFLSPSVWAAIVIQAVGFVVWAVVISRIKLGVAFALAGACLYILMAFASWQLYGERLTPMQWLGIVLVSAGVLMISQLGQTA